MQPVPIRRLWNFKISDPLAVSPSFRSNLADGWAFFSVRVVQLWNKLPEDVVSAGSVGAYISRLHSIHVCSLMYCFCVVRFNLP